MSLFPYLAPSTPSIGQSADRLFPHSGCSYLLESSPDLHTWSIRVVLSPDYDLDRPGRRLQPQVFFRISGTNG